jgi:hypothetical protein
VSLSAKERYEGQLADFPPVKVDRHLYFVHAIPEEATSLSLPELHQVLQDYIARDDNELVELAKEREQRAWRKGEGKTKREVELEKQKESDTSEYRSGFGASPFDCGLLTLR